ncbi:uncharacterized protein LODBEIA_P14660 [Lodderomyces beijingensis]|uniref:Potassium transport protein n=1 Tax=Lodderomyces beijingensis TaxID=1775926 RepID=A0ABP0ZGF4_9ASCO
MGNIGLHTRNVIQKVISAIYPYAKVVLPNFRAVHYFYIITCAIVGSILVYPVKTARYIDVLFFTSGASTQAGLNTVDLVDLSLYQQITLYLLAWLTTPIFIHGSLLFVRLYYFERHFDNIKERSKLDFKMRRTATLARQRTGASMNSTEMNTANNEALGIYHKEKGSETPQSSTSTGRHAGSVNNNINNNVEHYSEPSDDEKMYLEPEHPEENKSHGIQFAALPHPRRRKSVDPEDMMRSINMLQEEQKTKNNKRNSISFINVSSPSKSRANSSHKRHLSDVGTNASPRTGANHDDDDDDVLVIKPPTEIENSGSLNPIFTKKHPEHLLQFKEPLRKKNWLQGGGGGRTGGVRAKRHYRPWTSKLKKSFSNRKFSSTSTEAEDDDEDENDDDDEEEDDDDESIDSEHLSHRDDLHSTHHSEGDDDGDDDDDDVDDDDDDDEDDDGDDEDDDNEHAVVDNEEDANDEEGESKLPHVTSAPKSSNDIHFVEPSRNREKQKQNAARKRQNKKIKKKPFDLRRIKTPSLHAFHSHQEGSIRNAPTNDLETTSSSLSRTMSGNYLSWTPTVGRNSTFIKMTEEQKEELGGIEYRAVKLLIKIILIYYFGFHILPAFMFLIWVYCMPNYKNMLNEMGIVPGWWAFFTISSSFNDLGFTLTPNSMVSFNQNAFVQIVGSFLIVIGNTGFPVFLRFIIWIMFITAKPLSLYKESLGFLLDHPRRCFTLLFPSIPTWWLFFILIVLNGFDLVIFCILDLNSSMFDGIPKGYRVLNGLFQAFCTRTSGFAIMDLSQLHAATLVSYLIMMYISVLPIAISVRRTNVYEEQSLGVYAPDEGKKEADEKAPSNYVGAHLRNQLSYDLWYIFLGLFVICIAEGKKLQQSDVRFSIFAVLFEIISAYGTVGLSLGYPDVNTSLSGKFNVISKLVIIAMMIRGRHRGLPYAIDRAIMLPDADMKRHDRLQENHAINRHRTLERAGTLSRVATMTAGPLDGGHNLLNRVLTDVNNFIEKRRGSKASLNGEESAQQSTHSSNTRYHVTSVDQV